MSVTVSPAQSAIFVALRSFIMGLITCPVERGLQNGTAMPDEPFILMTEVLQSRLSTNVASYNDPVVTDGNKSVMQPTKYDIQIDCYGPLASDWAKILVTMFNDGYALDKMGPDVAPLYADDARQAVLVNGEENYEMRWIFTVCMQYNPVVTVTQQFAGALEANLINVDATYPPT